MKTFKKLLSITTILTLINTSAQTEECQVYYNPGYTFSEKSPFPQINCRYFNIQTNIVINSNVHPYLVKIINFEHSSIPKLPSKLFESYPETRIIYLKNIKIRTIQQDAFYRLFKLSSLDLAGNEIEEIQEGTFRNLTSLRTLNLSRNKFSTLSKLLLHGLSNLEELILSHNRIVEINPLFFQSISKLRSLNLGNNRIYEIPSDAFTYVPYLFKLSINNNFIEYISNDTFQKQNGFGHLDLSDNYLIEFNFNNLILVSLNMSNNTIQTVPLISNIDIIDLTNNNISDIAVGKSVKHLSIGHNQLEFLNKSNLEKAIDLVYLNLSNNRISEIEKGSFKNLINLETLDLNNNDLSTLSVGSFQNLSNLWELYLSNNSLYHLEFGTFSGLDNLTVLYLDHNKLNEIHEKSFYVLGKLKSLYLNDNVLDKLDINELLKEVPSMNTITLANNKWTCETLFTILNDLSVKKIGFHNGSDVNVENVHGIACRENNNEDKVEFLRQDPYLDFRKSLFQYFDKDFKNSFFYKFFQFNFTGNPLAQHLQSSFKDTRFFKFFQGKPTRTDFFKYSINDKTNLVVDDDYDDKSFETTSENYYY